MLIDAKDDAMPTVGDSQDPKNQQQPQQPSDQLSEEDLFKAIYILTYREDYNRAIDCLSAIGFEADMAADKERLEWVEAWLSRLNSNWPVNYRLAKQFFEELEREPAKKPWMDKKEKDELNAAFIPPQGLGTQYQFQAREITWLIVKQAIREKNREKLTQAKAMLDTINADPTFAQQFVEQVQKNQPAPQQQKKNFWQR